MKKNNILSTWPSYSDEEILIASNVLRSNKVNYLYGNIGKEFEKNFANYIKTKYAVALSNGTVALEVALRALKLNKNDEVIVTPRSYFASASSILNVHLKPKFADVNIETQNIDLETIKKAITKKTKVIICVHLAGLPCDMVEISKYAKKKNIFVIEDCSQAHGAKIGNRSVGSFGDIATWSFCNDKIISTAGEGGMITTNHYKYWKYIWSYKDQGKNYKKFLQKSKNYLFKYNHDSVGSNFRLTEIQSAIGNFQLKKLENWNIIRNNYADQLNQIMSKYPCIKLCTIKSNYRHAYYRYYFIVKKKLINANWSRDKLIKYLNINNIPCGSGSCPEIYLEKPFKLIYKNRLRLKNAFFLGKNTIALNLHHNLQQKEVSFICKKLNYVLREASIYE